MNTKIHSGEIWQKTQYLEHEDHANLAIKDHLLAQGFVTTQHPRIFTRNQQCAIVCLVDDIRSCSDDYHVDLPYLFDSNTTVITDNYLVCPSRFRVIHLPTSFFGIYSYRPDLYPWTPKRDFTFLVNRIDYRRFALMLDIAWRTHIDSGYINFNCEDRQEPHLTAQETFEKHWNQMDADEQQRLNRAYHTLRELMPYKNYNVEFDFVQTRAWLNIVVESYSSDNVISISEKIFRALVTPVPWTVYSGHYTVARLESLGFDCLSDLVNHNHYDRLKEVENKLKIFNWHSLETVKHLKTLDFETVKQRCLTASNHNQKLLAELKTHWSGDFQQWLNQLVL
jgi:hypothetical protein